MTGTYFVRITDDHRLLVNDQELTPSGIASGDSEALLAWALDRVAQTHMTNGDTITLNIFDHRPGGYGSQSVLLTPGRVVGIEELRKATQHVYSPPQQEEQPVGDDASAEQNSESALDESGHPETDGDDAAPIAPEGVGLGGDGENSTHSTPRHAAVHEGDDEGDSTSDPDGTADDALTQEGEGPSEDGSPTDAQDVVPDEDATEARNGEGDEPSSADADSDADADGATTPEESSEPDAGGDTSAPEPEVDIAGDPSSDLSEKLAPEGPSEVDGDPVAPTSESEVQPPESDTPDAPIEPSDAEGAAQDDLAVKQDSESASEDDPRDENPPEDVLADDVDKGDAGDPPTSPPPSEATPAPGVQPSRRAQRSDAARTRKADRKNAAAARVAAAKQAKVDAKQAKVAERQRQRDAKIAARQAKRRGPQIADLAVEQNPRSGWVRQENPLVPRPSLGEDIVNKPQGKGRSNWKVWVAILLALLALLAIKVRMSTSPDVYTAVCIDNRTMVRESSDYNCQNQRAVYYRWFYVRNGGVVPAINQQADMTQGSTLAPASNAAIFYGFREDGGVAGVK